MEPTDDQIDKYEAWVLRQANKDDKKRVAEDFDVGEFYSLYLGENASPRLEKRLASREVAWSEILFYYGWMMEHSPIRFPWIINKERHPELLRIVDQVTITSQIPIKVQCSTKMIHLRQPRRNNFRTVCRFLSSEFRLFRMDKYISRLVFRTGSDVITVAGEVKPGHHFVESRQIGGYHPSVIQIFLLISVYWKYSLVPTGLTKQDTYFSLREKLTPELEAYNMEWIFDIALMVAGFSDYVEHRGLLIGRQHKDGVRDLVFCSDIRILPSGVTQSVEEAQKIINHIMMTGCNPDGTRRVEEVVADHHAQGSVPLSMVID